MRRSWPMPRTSFQGRSAVHLLPLLSLTLAILACSVSLHMGAAPLKVADVPAAQLRIEIQISNQFSDEPNIMVLPRFFEGANPRDQVALPAGGRVTCNGADITPISGSYAQPSHPCPRQPAGGAYRITYTDTHKASATVIVPVPAGGSFEILSPAPDTTVHIPANGQLAIRYSVPVPPPNGTVTLDNVAAECRSTVTGCVLSAFAPFGETPASGGNAGNAPLRPAIAVHPLATPQPGPTPKPLATATAATNATAVPGSTPVPPPAPTRGNALATVTVRGGVGTILLRGDFSTFQPVVGTISLGVEGQETLDHAGFAAASATFSYEDRTNNVTWIH